MNAQLADHASQSVSSLKTTQQISMEFGIGGLHWKLLGKLYFGLYWSNVTPLLHMMLKTNFTSFLKNCSLQKRLVHEITYRSNYYE
jgi:hypothetical protein